MGTYEPDEIDRQILQVLEEDPRLSNRKISETVGLTPQAVGIRIRKLREAGIIGGIKVLKPLPKLSKVGRKIERFKTNIAGFDDYTEGGFPIPSTVLMIGESGAGTTVFCLKLLWSALNERLNCVYFAIERPSDYVRKQMKHFGWDPHQSENIKFIDVHDMISRHLEDSKTLSHLDVLKIYRSMFEAQKQEMVNPDILFFDNLTELTKFAKSRSIEMELVNLLGTSIIKQRSAQSSFYVVKPHFVSDDALNTLKSYSDCVIRFRYELKHQTIHRFILLEKMLLTNHSSSEIEFHIDRNGLILDEYLLQQTALQNPVEANNKALFQIPELDYLTQGLVYGSSWLLEIDSRFPLRDLIKLYAHYFTDGLERQSSCRFAMPNFSLDVLLSIFAKSIQESKPLQKDETELLGLILQGKLTLYDFLQRTGSPEADPSYFEPVIWSHNPEKNLAKLGSLFTNPAQTKTYFGLILSDLMDLRLNENQLIWYYEYLLKMNQKQKDILLATINPSLHKSQFINKIEYISDGIIKLWVNPSGGYEQEKYIQIVKTPQGKPSRIHQLKVRDDPPYFQIA